MDKHVDPILKWTIIGVITLHLVAMVAMVFTWSQETWIKPKEKIVVQTIQLQAPVIASVQKPVVQKVSQTAPQKTVVKPKPQNQKTVVKSKQQPQKKQPNRKNQELLAQAQKSLAQHNKPVNNSQMKLPNQIKNLEVDSEDNFDDYRLEIASRLKIVLRLPEKGDVKIKLTLTRLGKVTNLEVLSAVSAKNKDYVLEKIPSINFAHFGKQFGSKREHTFLITLSGE